MQIERFGTFEAKKDLRSAKQRILDAIHDVNMARSARFEPDFGAETYKYPETGEPNSFTAHDQVGKYKAIGSKGGYTEVKSKVIVAYDQNGKVVGALNISLSEPVGAFKIVVREDAQRQGWGAKLLDEAEKLGFDMVGFMRQNTFSHSGRQMAEKWLQAKLAKEELNETFVPKRVVDREDDDNEAAQKSKIRSKIKKLLELFHSGELTLDQLHLDLLDLNPYSEDSFHHDHYIGWVDDNIFGYKNGDEYLLSMTSSGGMLASLED